ncbi:outer membrane protein assembly factor BamD [Salinibacter sp. 10B]|uniref:outer membrane protein assembly factor BamD n=1 Tax=Salinibacter sp. 10B TaxID=1923971 RepID=UPI000CF3B33B|nr:outer membrane protein assembly factor BamD [Salinibacter sp. 10B]PQJ35994.1 outer membrane protein assembly factor BamD [Salinibacter sp. 10B]
MRLSVLSSVLSLALLIGLVGCSGSQGITTSGPQDAYEKGVAEYEEEDYDRAIRYFRSVLNYGRGNEWAPDAQFKLAMAQRKKGKYLVAANEFRRFTQLYRNNQMVPRAEYEQARAYYARSPGYHLDQTDTRKAIELFQLFRDRHPDHKLAPKAQDKIDELRAKLAHKQFDAAKLYERRDMWPAATVAYESVFDQYPDTPWADDALLGALRSYIRYADRSIQEKQAERYQQALDQYARLQQLFPESPVLEQAEPLRAEARRKLKEVRSQEQRTQSLAREGGSADSAN